MTRRAHNVIKVRDLFTLRDSRKSSLDISPEEEECPTITSFSSLTVCLTEDLKKNKYRWVDRELGVESGKLRCFLVSFITENMH